MPNGFSQQLDPIPPTEVSPRDMYPSRPEIPLQRYRLSIAAKMNAAVWPGFHFQLPPAEQIFGGHYLLDGKKTVSAECRSVMAESFYTLRGLLLNGDPQENRRRLQHIEKLPLIMVDGVPAKDFFTRQQHNDRLSQNDIDALCMAAMISGEHRVEGVLFVTDANDNLKTQIVSLQPDMSALDQQEIAGHTRFWQMTGNIPRGEKARHLWEKDENREARHDQIRAYVTGEIRKNSSKSQLWESRIKSEEQRRK